MSIYELMREPPAGVATGRGADGESLLLLHAPLQGAGGEARSAGGEAQSIAAVATTLTRYVPTEALAMYTAILPFLVSKTTALSKQDYTGRWIVVGVIAAVAIMYAAGRHRHERRATSEGIQWGVLARRCGVVLVAYAAWVCVVPGSPFNAFSWYTPATGAAIGILTAGVLGGLTYLFEP